MSKVPLEGGQTWSTLRGAVRMAFALPPPVVTAILLHNGAVGDGAVNAGGV